MKAFLKYGIFCLLAFVVFGASLVFAQEVVVAPPTTADFEQFLVALGGAKTLGTMGVVALVVQGLMLVLKSSVGTWAGKYRMTLLALLTMLGGIIGLKNGGSDWASVLTHSTTLVAVQVFLHQIYKQFVEKTT